MTFATAVARANAAIFAHMGQAAVLDNVMVAGIFDAPTSAAFAGQMLAQDPTFTLPSSACTRVREGASRLRIVDGHTYIVRQVESDGQGLTILSLTRDVRA